RYITRIRRHETAGSQGLLRRRLAIALRGTRGIDGRRLMISRVRLRPALESFAENDPRSTGAEVASPASAEHAPQRVAHVEGTARRRAQGRLALLPSPPHVRDGLRAPPPRERPIPQAGELCEPAEDSWGYRGASAPRSSPQAGEL